MWVQCNDFFLYLAHFAQETYIHILLPFSMACLALAVLQDDGEVEAEAEDARLISDPSITAGDLELALEKYFTGVGYRNMEEVLQCIRDARCTWKTAPKARA